MDIDRIIRAIWFDPVMILIRPSLKESDAQPTCSSLSWLLPAMGYSMHACS